MDEKHDRAIAFVDGFNVYHFLRKSHPYALWLDYQKLACEMLPSGVTLADTYLFTAFARWDQEKVNRHGHYLETLKSLGVKTIVSRFQNREKNVIVLDDSSEQVYKTRDGNIKGRIVRGYVNEEKQTDVSIAAHVVALAAKDDFDIALLISGDTDFIPVVEIMTTFFPEKKIIVAVPNTRVPAKFLQLLPNSCRRIKGKHLRPCLLDNPVVNPKGNDFYCPKGWLPQNTDTKSPN